MCYTMAASQIHIQPLLLLREEQKSFVYLYKNFLEELLWHYKIQIYQGLDKTFEILPEGGLGITFHVLHFSNKISIFW